MPDQLSGVRASDVGLLDPLRHGTRQQDLTDDAAWLQAMVDAELALTRALVDAGLAPDWMRAVCDELADASRLDAAAIAAAGRGGGNPVIPLVKHLSAAAEAVRKGASDHIHVGATSQDILDTAAMLIARAVTGEVRTQLTALAAALAALADAHRSTPLAGRTLGQQASPTSFGFVAAGWLDAVLTMIERTDGVRAGLPAQLGGAVGNLAVLTEVTAARLGTAAAAAAAAAVASAAATATGPGDVPAPAGGENVVQNLVEGYARHLGLAPPRLSWHTNRLPVVELGSLLAEATGVVGKFALDVVVLSRTEIGELSERLGAGEGGSSAMPHKRNPVTGVLIVSAARQAPGLLATLHSSLLAEDQRPAGAWHAEWLPLRELERLALSAVTAAASLAERLDVDADRMAANLELTDGLVFSERVSAILTDALGKKAAFELVESASKEAFRTRRPLNVVLSGLLASAGSDDALRTRVWAACTAGSQIDQASAAIDRVLQRHRQLSAAAPERISIP